MTRRTASRGRIDRGFAWAGACVALAAGVVAAWSSRPGAPTVPAGLVETAPPAARAAAAPVVAAPAEPVAPERAAAPAPKPARFAMVDAGVASAADPVSKWAKVNALVASGKPADAFAAYRILSLCAVVQALQQVEDHSGDPAQRDDRGKLGDKCGDLSPGQLGGRVRLLESAADAHVPGAVAALMNQGPDGQPVAEIWDDPAFADWRRRTLERVEAEADRGDPIALQLMVGQHDRGQRPLSPEDSAAALKYYTAYADVQIATDPAFASPTRRESLELLVHRLGGIYGASLSPDEFAAAVAAGHALVAQIVANAPPQAGTRQP